MIFRFPDPTPLDSVRMLRQLLASRFLIELTLEETEELVRRGGVYDNGQGLEPVLQVLKEVQA